MKKAFEQNVSRAKPRVRLASMFPEVGPAEEAPEQPPAEAVLRAPEPEPVVAAAELGAEVKARSERARAPKLSAAEAVERALADVQPEPSRGPRSVTAEPVTLAAQPPPPALEVQTPPAPLPLAPELAPAERRERLKERLAAVRENPRPEPLPPTVAEAGVLAVERIASLQAELGKLKALNLALTQDLEAARRQSERATEEARLRMDEAQRLAGEMEARAALLADLERELSSLEGERDEALLSLQESRRGLEQAGKERQALEAEIAKRDQALAESLSEEERLAGELEASHDEGSRLRRALEALQGERDTLARQVTDLTRERAELLEARKALEAVHRALAQAVAR